jgi:adenylosuccinate lyase
MNRLVTNLEIDTERMATNLHSLQGVVFSQSVFLALVESGMTRDDAYRVVQTAAAQALESATPLRDVLASNSAVTLTDAQLASAFDLPRVLRHAGRTVDAFLNA